MDLNNVNIIMVRDRLDNIPVWDLADGFSFRYYEPGDMNTWFGIERKADPYDTFNVDMFETTFSNRVDLLEGRMVFICDREDNAVATSTAWYENERTGLVHWVAVVPGMQGRGLAKPLLAHTMNRLAELGHENAMLRTQIFRIPAINLYIKAGFVPLVRSEQDKKCWEEVSSKFKASGLDGKVIETALKTAD
ncbi:MAG: GNAT family N-acetyltransferase [Sedimentisphaeraceae bacterium JB056]